MTDLRNHTDLNEERHWIEQSKLSPGGFEPIYNRYYDEIFRFIYRRTSDRTLSDDLTSETFYKALKNIRKFKYNGHSIGSWIYTIARNEVSSHYRTGQKQFIVEIDQFEAELGPDNEQVKYDTEDLVWVLEQISDDELMLIELKYFERKPFREVALLMKMKESAVKMKLYRLLLSMKTKIEKRDGRK